MRGLNQPSLVCVTGFSGREDGLEQDLWWIK
jgi:hypothetical protein